jgi:outer membrane protein assembly factor BamB
MFAALGSSTLLVTSFDALHLLNLSTGTEIWHGGAAGASNPVIVSDPALGVTVYVTDGTGVIALVPG